MKMIKKKVSERFDCHICKGIVFLEDKILSMFEELYEEFSEVSEKLQLWDVVTVPFIYKNLSGDWFLVKHNDELTELPLLKNKTKSQVCKAFCKVMNIGEKICLDKNTCLICLKDYVKMTNDKFSYFWNDYGIVFCYRFGVTESHIVYNIVNIRQSIPDECNFKLEHLVKTGIVKK